MPVLSLTASGSPGVVVVVVTRGAIGGDKGSE